MSFFLMMWYNSRMKRVCFVTQGCRLNQSETASLENAFRYEGYDLVHHYQDADNTI